jgi:hydroxylaminobenzene mutase
MPHRLLRYGFLLFFLGLVTGFAVPAMVNPRAGVAGHLEGLMNGMFLVVVGLAWPALRLSERAGRVVSWLLLFGAYANWVATTASGVLSTTAACAVLVSRAWRAAPSAVSPPSRTNPDPDHPEPP